MLVVRMEEWATGDGIRCCCGLWCDRIVVPEEEGDTNASDGGEVRLRLRLRLLLPAIEEVPNCSCREGSIPAAHVEVQAYATRKYTAVFIVLLMVFSEVVLLQFMIGGVLGAIVRSIDVMYYKFMYVSCIAQEMVMLILMMMLIAPSKAVTLVAGGDYD